jgi:hypothetical protein
LRKGRPLSWSVETSENYERFAVPENPSEIVTDFDLDLMLSGDAEGAKSAVVGRINDQSHFDDTNQKIEKYTPLPFNVFPPLIKFK